MISDSPGASERRATIASASEPAVRTQALITNQVDAINRVNQKTLALLSKNKSVRIVTSKGAGNRFCFVALIDMDPYKSGDVMLGLKFGIDREKIVKNVFSGYASIGNDQTIGPMNKYYNKALKPRAYDPDKAAFYFKKAGMSGPFELQVSEGAYTGATDSAVIYQESLKKATQRPSSDGVFSGLARGALAPCLGAASAARSAKACIDWSCANSACRRVATPSLCCELATAVSPIPAICCRVSARKITACLSRRAPEVSASPSARPSSTSKNRSSSAWLMASCTS